MAQRQRRVPVWMKVILVLLAVCTVLSTACWGLCYMEAQNAEQRGTLPALGGYRYSAVPDERYGPRYPAGSLIVLDAHRDCRVGDTVLWRTSSEQESRLLVVWLEEQTDGLFTGVSVGEDPTAIALQDGEVLGVICRVLPVLGTVWEWMTSPAGPVMFGVVPAALCVLWGAVMLRCAARRQAARGRKPHSRPKAPKTGTEPEVFDVFTDPSASQPDSLALQPDSLAPQPNPTVPQPNPTAPQPDPSNPSSEPSVPPPGASAAPSGPAVPPAEEALLQAQEAPAAPPESEAVPKPTETAGNTLADGTQAPASPETDPAAAAPRDPAEDETVAIYTGPADAREAESFEPAYLHRELSGSLEQLRDTLRQTSKPDTEGRSILSQEDAVRLDSRGRALLEQIQAFDPDQVIEEIKRQNALYSQALGLDQMSRQPRRHPENHSSFIAVMEEERSEEGSPGTEARKDRS